MAAKSPEDKANLPVDEVESRLCTNASGFSEAIAEHTEGHPSETRSAPPPPRKNVLPAFRSHMIPDKLRLHELVAGATFYVLPSRLLNALARNIPAIAKLDLWYAELQLATIAESLFRCVGFHSGEPIFYDLLVEQSASNDLSIDDLKDCADWKGITPQLLKNVLAEADSRFEWTRKVAKAYCGWLLTNSDFLAEYEQFASHWHEFIQKLGFPQFGVVGPDAVNDVDSPVQRVSDVEQKFATAAKEFCVRWQLKNMTGPYLPDPLLPQFPVLSSNMLTETMREGGVFIYLPRTFALMGERKLREVLEDVIRGTSAAAHLRAWEDVASARRNNKGQEFDRLGRLFEMQHYRRVFYSRWEKMLRRKKTDVMQAFADFFHVSLQQIKNDVRRAS